MPHHWKPFDPGNPDCQRVVEDLLKRYGDGLLYVGSDGEKCWALYETGRDEQEDDTEQQQRHPCERELEDEYVKEGFSAG